MRRRIETLWQESHLLKSFDDAGGGEASLEQDYDDGGGGGQEDDYDDQDDNEKKRNGRIVMTIWYAGRGEVSLGQDDDHYDSDHDEFGNREHDGSDLEPQRHDPSTPQWSHRERQVLGGSSSLVAMLVAPEIIVWEDCISGSGEVSIGDFGDFVM